MKKIVECCRAGLEEVGEEGVSTNESLPFSARVLIHTHHRGTGRAQVYEDANKETRADDISGFVADYLLESFQPSDKI